jgi:hypothetical protein
MMMDVSGEELGPRMLWNWPLLAARPNAILQGSGAKFMACLSSRMKAKSYQEMGAV